MIVCALVEREHPVSEFDPATDNPAGAGYRRNADAVKHISRRLSRHQTAIQGYITRPFAITMSLSG